jgi:hypothetical protein
MFTYIPKTPETEKSLFDLRHRFPAFDKFLTDAGIPGHTGSPNGEFLTHDRGGLVLFHHYKALYLECYRANKELIQDFNAELCLEDWFDLETDEALPVEEGGCSFEQWLCEEGGTIGREGMCYMLLHALGSQADFEAYFDYGGEEDWYRVFVRLPGERQFTGYYL